MSPPVRYSGCTNISLTETGKTFNACVNVTNLQLNSKNDAPVGERVAFTSIFVLLVLLSLGGNITVLVSYLHLYCQSSRHGLASDALNGA